MFQNCLVGLATISTEKQIVDALDTKKVFKNYVSFKARKVN